MPLSRIEVCDFKSYRGHQTIGPFQNFTSVIGPNGAGKSNLMDAISFVLGVKSAQLRSSQLKDLIYRGRKVANIDQEEDAEGEEDEEADLGEGTASKAWVLAVFVDSAGKEWRFQRTISTSGSSEYRLNGKVTTYSAYNETLVSHNILVKAKNFLVFQGDVEAVASQSPRELTKLVEQISGSLELASEYEKAKEDQDKATENATLNFNKRRGIAGEIRQYKEQKGEAERFEALCEERDDKILHRMLFKLFHIEESIERNTRDIQAKGKALAGLREQHKEHEDAYNQARAEQAKARTVVQQREKQLKKSEKARADKIPDVASLDAQIKHSERKQANASKASEEAIKSTEAMRAKIDSLEKERASVQKAADVAQETQRQQSQHNLSLSPESLEEYRRLKASASVLAVDERQQVESLTRDLKSAGRLLTQLEEKQQTLIEKRDKLLGDQAAREKEQEELEDKIKTQRSEYSRIKKELEDKTNERKRIKQLEGEINEKLNTVQTKLLSAGLERNETEREARFKEAISNLQRLFPGVRGRVVDLCKPTQRKYETAVSVILGRNIDAIVVDEEKTAIDCIDYMRNQRAGHATFIPLDTIQVKPINDRFRTFAKGARLAVDVIQYEPVVERAIHHACGNALVCDTMDIARYVSYERGQEVKAVTIEGTVIHKSGLITGGRSSHTSQQWNDKDVQGLTRQRDALLTQLRELHKQKPREKEEDQHLAELNRLEPQLNVSRDDLNALKLKIDGIKGELKHVSKEIEKNEPQLRKEKKAHADLTAKVDRVSSVIYTAEDGIYADFCRSIGVADIREYEHRQLKVAEEGQQARLRFQNQINRLGHQIEFESEQLATSEARLKTLQSIMNKESAALAGKEKEKEELSEEIAEMDRQLKTLQEKLDQAKEALEEETTKLEQVKKTASKSVKILDNAVKGITNMNDDIEKLSVERSAIYRKCRVEEIRIPLLQGNLKRVPMEENFTEEARMDVDEDEDAPLGPRRVEDFGIEVDFAGVSDEDREDGSPARLAELEAEISKLGSEIENMAPNMKAMDRLNDVETKLAETEKETDQARRESKTAREKFADIRRKRCDMFNKAYNHISERIDHVYKDLTKGKAAPMGGVAYLSLEDNEEPYLAGIKYHAMPPMKRFRDMEQLSGGEKTVAALALLFAIHSYQPAPFFVLDEVDAALDNTNVAKVAAYIKTQASPAFQFVVISLKSSLYERGDSLVGIYRDQDINGSRTLTLDLTQYDE